MKLDVLKVQSGPPIWVHRPKAVILRYKPEPPLLAKTGPTDVSLESGILENRV